MKRLHMLIAIAGLGLGASHAAHAAELAGIALDQPVTLDECAQRQHDYLPDDRSTCFKLPAGPARDPYADKATPPANGRILVNVALSDRPVFMSGSDAVVQLRDGRVVSVSVRTHGSNGETGDFRALEDRFGNTTKRQLATPWNIGRGQVTQTQATTRADWMLSGDQSVYFNSGEFGVYDGLVRLQTSAAPAHQNGVWD